MGVKEQAREAFDGDSVPAKNIALRYAYDRLELLEAAIRSIMIGGNHVALLIGTDHPDYTETHDAALAHYGAGDQYEAWCCWRSIMCARDALESTPN